MKKLAFIGLGLSSLALLSSCFMHCVHGSGHTTTQSRNIDSFSRLEISGAYKVNLKQDSGKTITLSGDDNILKYIHVDNDGDKLHIYSKKSLCSSGDITLNISVSKLTELRASGAISFVTDGQLTTGDLNLHFSGACSGELNLNAANVTTDGSGATELTLKGQATSHHVDVSGQGTLHAFDFVVGSYDIQSSGASDCEINVLKSLEVHSSGSSDVKYKGNPSNVQNDKSGAGSVSKVD